MFLSRTASGGRGWLRAIGGGGIVVLALAVEMLLWGGHGRLRNGVELPVFVIPTLTAAVYALLLLRGRHPVKVFAVQWLWGFASLLAPEFSPFIGILIALYTVALRTRTRTAVLALAACGAPFAIQCYNGAEKRSNLKISLAASFAPQFFLYAVLALTVWALGRVSYGAERRRRREREREAVEAVRAERLRLARELHDIVAHAVTGMLLQAAGARTLVKPEDEHIGQALKVIETAGAQAISELQRLLGLLRTTDDDSVTSYIEQQPTLSEIDVLIDLARASDVRVERTVEGEPCRLDPSVGLAAYRVVQEALTNTIRYAGPGATAYISLLWDGERVTVAIRDVPAVAVPNRPRSTSLSTGHGLRGLTERVHLVGGSLEAGPVDGGFLVRAILPVTLEDSRSRSLAHVAQPSR